MLSVHAPGRICWDVQIISREKNLQALREIEVRAGSKNWAADLNGKRCLRIQPFSSQVPFWVDATKPIVTDEGGCLLDECVPGTQ